MMCPDDAGGAPELAVAVFEGDNLRMRRGDGLLAGRAEASAAGSAAA